MSIIMYRGINIKRLVYMGVELFNSSATPELKNAETVSLLALGDSTIAAGYGGEVVPSYRSDRFSPIASTAAGGSTISAQKSKFLGLTDYSSYDVVIIQIGLNDTSTPTDELLSKYQDLVDTVKSKVTPSCKVYISKMIPCKGRTYDPDRTDLTPEQQALMWGNWLTLNYAIINSIKGVDGRIQTHNDELDRGDGWLKPEYDTGDGIHQTPSGRQVVADSWVSKLILDGVLSEGATPSS